MRAHGGKSSGEPIFILGLQRGGTNQLLNVLRSHPDTAWPEGEFNEVLRPFRRMGRQPLSSIRTLLGYGPMLLRMGDALNPHRAYSLQRLTDRDRAWIGAVLERETRRNAEVARYKWNMAARGLYPNGPARMDRMVVKLVNYNVGFAEDLLRIYPGARFIGLLRDAFGVCESMISRGARPDRVVPLYIYFVERLVQLQEKGLPLRIIRFEDLLADIREASESIYRFCGLDPMETTGLCLQDKQRVLDTGGRVIGTKKVDRFADFGCIGAHLREDVNAKAKARLPSELRRRIAEECGPILSRFGYVSEVRAT